MCTFQVFLGRRLTLRYLAYLNLQMFIILQIYILMHFAFEYVQVCLYRDESACKTSIHLHAYNARMPLH